MDGGQVPSIRQLNAHGVQIVSISQENTVIIAISPGISCARRRADPPAGPQCETVDNPTADILSISTDASAHPLAWRSWKAARGWLLSALVHLAIVLLLASLIVSHKQAAGVVQLLASLTSEESEPLPSPADDASLDVTSEFVSEVVAVQAEEAATVPDIEGAMPGILEPHEPVSELTFPTVFDKHLAQTLPNSLGNRLAMPRDAASRRRLVASGGGNDASEAAVARGLAWLAEQQDGDGSWSFETNIESRTGATGFALLCFLGAGQTHRAGEYQQAVGRGLQFLARTQGVTLGHAGDLRGSLGGHGMHCHGLATFALCEAYALTQDKKLRPVAQRAVEFTALAQHPETGSWGYKPQPRMGELSVFGWQVMSLKAAELGYLRIPPRTVSRLSHYLDLVQLDDYGGHYAYNDTQAENLAKALRKSRRRRKSVRSFPAGTTAIGLLCRICLCWDAWEAEHPGLVRGVHFLAEQGPAENNMYYNYYATQVMHHWGGPLWRKWNGEMRNSLLRRQVQSDTYRGSWSGICRYSNSGGRLYETCMAILTLEVYYRYLPVYDHHWKTGPARSR